MTDITELAQRMKAAAVRAKTATEEYASGHMSISVCYAECEEFNRLTDGPDNIIALVEALEKAQQQMTESENRVRKQNRHICELFDDNTALRQRIAELESRLNSADKLQDSAFRSGLQHGFSLGQTDDQKGYEQSMAAYSPDAGNKVEAE
ncbi:hypothetical protein KMY75_15540 [Klebsiella quasipneumoniae]|nr:hypothetical protein [Klebsiella quasipneumoniae]MCK6037649.1 hypothetical protein [Klebsiella quasipneumoniae]